MNNKRFEIIDISQPISQRTACFPGDRAFSREISITHQDSQVLNLTSFSMSPHVGTHADAPVHVRDDLHQSAETAGNLALAPYVGPCVVVNVSPLRDAVTWAHVAELLTPIKPFPTRVLFKTQRHVRFDVWEDNYAWLSPELIRELAALGTCLVGLDTPSVDHVDSKTLLTHHTLLETGMSWLENLDFSAVDIARGACDSYFLAAQPLKFMQLEASPLRAILLKWTAGTDDATGGQGTAA